MILDSERQRIYIQVADGHGVIQAHSLGNRA